MFIMNYTHLIFFLWNYLILPIMSFFYNKHKSIIDGFAIFCCIVFLFLCSVVFKIEIGSSDICN
jgi:hypothetical protein